MLEKLGLIPLSNIVKNKSIQNFLFLAIIQSSNILITIISMPLLIQGIGVDQFGLVNLALSVIILLNIIVGFGYNLNAPREVAINQQNRVELSHIVSNIFSAKILLATIASLAIIIGVFGFNLFQEYQVILVFSLMLLFSEATLPLWFFQGMEKMKLVSIANIFSKLLFLLGIVLFIHKPEQSKWVNFMMGFFGLGVNIFLLIYIRIYMRITFYRPEFHAIWKSLKSNVLLFFSNLGSHIAVNGGLIILSFFTAAETLGMYSLAERVIMVMRMLPSLIVQAVYPNAAKLYSVNKKAFVRFSIKVLLLSIGLSAFLSLVTFLWSDFIISVLSRESLPKSVEILKILAFIPLLASFNIWNIIVFLINDQKQLMFRTSWLMCIYMLIASVFATAYYGEIGLAFALLSTEVVAFIISCYFNWSHNKALVLGLFTKN
ncbi:oligosaccharide flippase family protein [Algoriphagus winogradskyi]|uniref:Polysaccharide transporter, PST family n=1 Tax=Algoriphagus winogradskyi TaxID=237017 RepID=A0ABY1NN12_9BACT|nr:oligosaccharide flippase family protein [Algoriphagus winogradskyi]SMP13994.1 polysaccharide transporter, PST family [Algoriphagus winogradskyi]